jgi:glutathione S-transferase
LIEERLAGSAFLAGERFTMGDLTAFLGFAGLVGWGAIEAGPALGRWLAAISPRSSMAPLHALAAQFGLQGA